MTFARGLLYTEVFRILFEKNPKTFFSTDLADTIDLVKHPNEKRLRQAKSINETYFVESNIDSNGKFEKIKYALEIFEAEDELSIKYAE